MSATSDSLDDLDDEADLDLPENDQDEYEPNPPLTIEEIVYGFLKATTGFQGGKERWAERAAKGLTDEQLIEALKYEIGIFGGQCGPNALGISYQGNGLKIWVDRSVGIHTRKPVLAGSTTVAMARAVYGIKDPNDKQMSFL